MRVVALILAVLLEIVPGGPAYLKQLQPRDSILIADQIEYGFRLDKVKEGTVIELPDFSKASGDTLTLVRNWQMDTVGRPGKKGSADIIASIIVAPFEEGEYELPSIPVRRTVEGNVDTLLFEGVKMSVRTMPVDTATFQIHDIKGQMRYPLTFREVAPWLALGWLVTVLAILIVCLVRMRKGKVAGETAVMEPAYIVALRSLDKFRGNRYWAPEKQKIFYSGITDALKNYVDGRFGIDAPEMTTAELFRELRKASDISPDLYDELKVLFERADFVKFAKYTASDEDNAGALPLAVRFVTETYQTEEPEEGRKDVL